METTGYPDATNIPRERARRSPAVDFFIRLVREKPLGTVGGIIVLILLLTAVFADWIAPYPARELHMGDALLGPSTRYIFGTDELGRDLFSRVVFGARVSMMVGLAGSALCSVVAAVIGLSSGYFSGKTDLVIQRFVDAWMCFPPIFMYLTVMTLMGQGLLQVVFVLGLVRGIGQSRVVRGAVVGIKENIYVEGAKATGCSPARILALHILPNVLAPLITIFVVSSGYMILSEATLSFLGFGIPPPTPSWGGMLGGSGRQYMLQNPWMVLWPGLVLAIAVYGMNMLGDAVRDLLDPRLRGGLGKYGQSKKAKARK